MFYHPERVNAMVLLHCTWNFQKRSVLETFSLSLPRSIFRLYPGRMMVNRSLAAAPASKASQELLRPAIERLRKDEFVQILTESAKCLHYEPEYKINKPLLLMVGDRDTARNIRKVMPSCAEHEPGCPPPADCPKCQTCS